MCASVLQIILQQSIGKICLSSGSQYVPSIHDNDETLLRTKYPPTTVHETVDHSLIVSSEDAVTSKSPDGLYTHALM